MGENMVRYSVYVTPKAGVLDPQGQATQNALKALGYEEVEDVRIGRFITLSLRRQGEEQERRVVEMCEKLLANPIIEDFWVEEETDGN